MSSATKVLLLPASVRVTTVARHSSGVGDLYDSHAGLDAVVVARTESSASASAIASSSARTASASRCS